MKDLKSFKNTAQSPEETLNKYKDLTDDELIGLLISQVKKAKEKGELDAEQTKRFVEIVSPRLTEEQRQKLDAVMKMADM
ncbi:unknown [Firmicutes bacterium CAG:552]|nr:unknown [Firmicutes bacterium CAG:552]